MVLVRVREIGSEMAVLAAKECDCLYVYAGMLSVQLTFFLHLLRKLNNERRYGRILNAQLTLRERQMANIWRRVSNLGGAMVLLKVAASLQTAPSCNLVVICLFEASISSSSDSRDFCFCRLFKIRMIVRRCNCCAASLIQVFA